MNGVFSIGQVIKLKPSGDQYTYFLHYMGWNSRWDKWVVESDLMAAGPEALEMQKQLKDKKKKQKVRRKKTIFPGFSACCPVKFVGTVARSATRCSLRHTVQLVG